MPSRRKTHPQQAASFQARLAANRVGATKKRTDEAAGWTGDGARLFYMGSLERSGLAQTDLHVDTQPPTGSYWRWSVPQRDQHVEGPEKGKHWLSQELETRA